MNKKVVAVMTAVMVLFMVLVGGGFYMMWMKITALAPPEEIVEEDMEDVAEVVEVGEMFPLDTFVVNLADSGGKRYLRATLQLELVPEQVAETFEQRLPQIRDVILTILPTKTFEDIRTVAGKAALREEILQRLNTLLNVEGVANIYFTEFVIQ